MAILRKDLKGGRKCWSLSEHSYQMIRKKILRGDYPLGAVLSRRRLAAAYQMSFLPISEALQRLEHDGLVESCPRVGTRVRVPSTQDIRGHYVIREALECQSARLCAEKASPDERLELRRMAEQLDDLFERVAQGEQNRDFVFKVHSHDMRLHRRIAECTGCSALAQAIERNQILVSNWIYDITTHWLRLPPRFHQDLLKVITGSNPEKAAAAMRHHIRFGLEDILTGLEEFVIPGEWRHRRAKK